MTLPAIYLLQQAGGRARKLLEAIVGERSFRQDAWDELRELLRKHQVLEQAFERAAGFAAEAKRHLAGFPPTPELDALKALPDYVLARDW